MTDSRGRRLRRAAVAAVVVFHLLLFAVRGAVSLRGPEVRARAGALDRATERYANLVGCEQDWRLFSAPVAREAAFPAWRLELSDGSAVTVRSAGEPADSAAYFRVGGWQLRRLEDHLVDPPAEREAAAVWPLWEAAARDRAAAWRRDHPGDPRAVRRVVLVRRLYTLPRPEADPARPAVSETDLAAFAPNGRAMP
jgi:hypothetical protein